jgi:drug/metabolite transporter (DMT)-like permease
LFSWDGDRAEEEFRYHEDAWKDAVKPDRTVNTAGSAMAALGALSLIWGYNWVVMKIALHDSGPFTFAALRGTLGALVLFPLMPRRGGVAIPKGTTPEVILLGVLQTTGFVGLTFWALVEGGVGKTCILVYTMPFWVLILARVFLGEKIRGAQWAAVTCAFAGLFLIFEPWHRQSGLFPQFLAVMAGISWSAGVILAKRIQRRGNIPLLQLTTWQMLFGSIPLVVIAIAVPQAPVHWTPYLVGALIYNVVLGNAVAWMLWLFILERLPAGIAGMGSLAIPVVGVLCAWLQLGEIPGIYEGTGMLLIGSALFILTWRAFTRQ